MLDITKLPMRVAAGQLRELTADSIAFIRQLGVQDVQFNCVNGSPHLPGETHWSYMDLVHLRSQCADAGLRLMAIENCPHKFYIKAILGLPGRDEQIDHMQQTIRNIGRAGIPIFGYNWNPNKVWRSSRTTQARGGAQVTSFDMEAFQDAPVTHGRVFQEEELWANYEYFIKAVLPVAEEVGVRLALHPNDPPMPSLGGIPRIARNFAGFERAMVQIGDSPMHGLNFCVGTWAEMEAGPAGVFRAIDFFGSRGRIFYVHFRNVIGTVPKFREAFIDEGDLDMFAVMQALHKVNFRGFLIDDHVPHLTNDEGWANRSRAYAIGQMQTMLRFAQESL